MLYYLSNRQQSMCSNKQYLQQHHRNNFRCAARFHSWTNPFYLFFFNEKASMYNFSNDNPILARMQRFCDLIKILEPGGRVAVDWFIKNKMVVSPEKFPVIVLDGKESYHGKKQ